MKIIPEEFVRSTTEASEHRVVFSVRWGSSWQLWLQIDKKGLFMVKEDWDEFVDDNFLRAKDILFFTHKESMFLDVRIFNKDGREIISAPLKGDEPESERLNLKPSMNTHPDTTPASASSGGTGERGRHGFGHVKTPEQYLLNPRNPYFVKMLLKKIDVLYVRQPVIKKYGLKFGPHNSTMSYLLPGGGKHDAVTKIYGMNPCFTGWAALCTRYNLKQGDTVVCELERSRGLVTSVRLHFVSQ